MGEDVEGEPTWKVLVRAQALLKLEQFAEARDLLRGREREAFSTADDRLKNEYRLTYRWLDRALRARGLSGASTLADAVTLLIENPVVQTIPVEYGDSSFPFLVWPLVTAVAWLALDSSALGGAVGLGAFLIALVLSRAVMSRPVERVLLLTNRSFGFAGLGADFAAVAEVRVGLRVKPDYPHRGFLRRFVRITLRDGHTLETFSEVADEARQALTERGVTVVVSDERL